LRYGVIARTMKHIYERDFLPVLKELIEDLRTIEGLGDIDYIYKLLSYIIEAGELDKQEFIETVKTGLTQVNEVNVMTLAEQFRQEGYERARIMLAEQFKKEGILEGEQRGEQKALKNVAVRLFNQGMTTIQVANITGLSIWEIEKFKGSISH
jgi:predicted transposase/invertase (TIGR01784 family)